MEFEWDEDKNQQNIIKHRVSFEDAVRIFESLTVDALDNRFPYGEERTISIGMLGGAVILVVVHTDRNGIRRIISARQADRKEKRRYDTAIQQSFNA